MLIGAHSPPRRAGVARSAGVVSWAETFRRSDHPVCAASVASHHFLMAQPPLLCEEGNAALNIASVMRIPRLLNNGHPRWLAPLWCPFGCPAETVPSCC